MGCAYVARTTNGRHQNGRIRLLLTTSFSTISYDDHNPLLQISTLSSQCLACFIVKQSFSSRGPYNVGDNRLWLNAKPRTRPKVF